MEQIQKTHPTAAEKGRRGENLAVEYLEQKGWKVIARNWRSRRGEIDILAVEPSRPCYTLVAVEVKSWWNSTWSDADFQYAIPRYKLLKIHRCFSDFLACHTQFGYHSYRIDAICIHNGRIEHFQGV